MKFSTISFRKTPEQKAAQTQRKLEKKQRKFGEFYTKIYKGEDTPRIQKVLHPKLYFAAKMMDACELPTKDIMKHADDLISHVSLEGKVLSLSDSYLRVLGYKKEDLAGKSIFDIVYPEDVELAKKTFETARRTGQSVKVELRLVAKDGNVIHVESKGSVIKDASGKIIGGIVINRDITARKKIKDELRMAVKELSEALEAKKGVVETLHTLFSIIAHDLRSPFHSFLGGLEMLSSTANDFTMEEIGELAGMLHGKAKGVFALLEGLLAWARLQGNGIKAVPEKTALKPLLERVVALLNDGARKKGITITIDAGDTAVFADPMMLGQAIQNLVSNAVKFTKFGGMISISATADGKNTSIIVSDNGEGMDAETLGKIFTTKMDSKDGTADEKGSGLGLLLVNDMVKLNGGTISAKSEQGVGTSFTVTLPANSPEEGKGTA